MRRTGCLCWTPCSGWLDPLLLFEKSVSDAEKENRRSHPSVGKKVPFYDDPLTKEYDNGIHSTN